MAYDDAARFLAQALPWPDPTQEPPEFFVNIHTPFVRKDGKVMWSGRACRTVHEAINYLGYVETTRSSDIYVCMSAQKLARAKTDKKGRTYWAAARSVAGAYLHKSFYGDIDVKPGAYPDTKTALDAFGKFCTAVGLPMPSFVILSGSGGFHVHWCLDDPIKTDRWLPLAQALAAAMRAHGLMADYPVTTDPARVLRVPETFNHKHTPPAPVRLAMADMVYSISRIEQALQPWRNQTSAPARISRPLVTNTMPPGFGPISRLAGPMRELLPQWSRSHPYLHELEKCCPFVEQARLTGGKDYRQPLWYETVKIAFYTVEGMSSLRRMASGYPSYDEAENQAMFDRIVRERTSSVDMYGWPLCQTIQNAGAVECAACPWTLQGRNANRSPFHFLGEDHKSPTTPPAPTLPVTSQVTLVSLPSPYQQDADGKIFMEEEVKQDDGSTTTKQTYVSLYPMRGFGKIKVKDNADLIVFQVLKDDEDWKFIEVPGAATNDMHQLGRVLGGQGLSFAHGRLRLMGEFLASFVEQLRDRKFAAYRDEKMGWSYVDGIADAWVYGGTRWNCKGNTPALIRDPVTRDLYQPCGQLQPWLDAFGLVSNRMSNVALVCAAIGAPFIEFTGQNGVLINGFSTGSGHLKSTSMMIGQAAIAHPKRALLNIDTINNVVETMAQARHLAVLWDEIGDAEKGIKLLEFVFGLTQGRSKGRLTRGSKKMPVEEWATALVTASNVDLIDLVEDSSMTTVAAMMRIFQFEVPELAAADRNADAEKLKIALNANYGHPYMLISQWLGANAATMSDRVNTVQKMIREDFKLENNERFYAAACTEMLMAAQLLNKLSLAKIDLDGFYKFLLDTVVKLRRRVDKSVANTDKEQVLVDYLSAFINDNMRYVVRTDIFQTGVGRQTVKCLNAHDMQRQPMQHLRVQFAESLDELRISRAAFMTHLTRLGLGPARKQILRAMKERLGAVDVRATIGAGTNVKFSNSNEPTLHFDLVRPSLQGLMSK